MPLRSQALASTFVLVLVVLALSACGGAREPAMPEPGDASLPTLDAGVVADSASAPSPDSAQAPDTAHAADSAGTPDGADAAVRADADGGPSYLRGFALSPQGFPDDYSGLPQFFAEVGQLGRATVKWNGPWRDDVTGGSNAGTAPNGALAVAGAAGMYGFTPVLVFGWRTGAELHIKVPADSRNDWSNTEAARLYREMLAAFARAHRPPYMFLGNESDFYYEQDPTDYERWLAVYADAYVAIKQASPATRVGPVFNHEHLAGRGALNGWTTAHWPALERHDLARVDIVGLSVYPFLQHKTPAEVPAGYLDALVSRIGGKPIAVTETGWPAEAPASPAVPWTASAQAQVEFVSSFFALIAGKDVRLANWLFLYQPVPPAMPSLERQLFDSIALREPDGAARPAHAAWIAR
jgi:hypothetical protein